MIIFRKFLYFIFNKSWYHISVFIYPRITIAPMCFEVLLYDSHLFYCSFLSVFLHLGINCGVYFQTTGVEVISILFAPVFQIVGYSFTEISSLTVVSVFYTVLQFDRNFF